MVRSQPELDEVSVALQTVISDHDTSQVHHQPVKMSVTIESDAVVPRSSDVFLPMFGLICALPPESVRLLSTRWHNYTGIYRDILWIWMEKYGFVICDSNII